MKFPHCVPVITVTLGKHKRKKVFKDNFTLIDTISGNVCDKPVPKFRQSSARKKKDDFGNDNHEMILIKEVASKVYVVALNYFCTIFVIQTLLVDLALNKV